MFCLLCSASVFQIILVLVCWGYCNKIAEKLIFSQFWRPEVLDPSREGGCLLKAKGETLVWASLPSLQRTGLPLCVVVLVAFTAMVLPFSSCSKDNHQEGLGLVLTSPLRPRLWSQSCADVIGGQDFIIINLGGHSSTFSCLALWGLNWSFW